MRHEELNTDCRESREADSLALRSFTVRVVNGIAIYAVAFGDMRKS